MDNLEKNYRRKDGSGRMVEVNVEGKCRVRGIVPQQREAVFDRAIQALDGSGKAYHGIMFHYFSVDQRQAFTGCFFVRDHFLRQAERSTCSFC